MKLESLKEFQLKNNQLEKINGGTHCFVTGTREFEGKTWFDYELRSGDGRVAETHCEVPDEDWGGGKYEIGQEIC